MRPDMCVPCGEGLINLRAGAIIARDGKLLMVGNRGSDYLYSVGGRIQMGETAEEAVVREVFEETGARLKVRRLAAIHENYFYGDVHPVMGKLIYELAFYFVMDVPDDFEPVARSVAQDGEAEFICWVPPDTPRTLYPAFFRTEDFSKAEGGVKYFIDDER